MTTTHQKQHTTKKHDIPALKERLLIPEAWRRLGLEGQPGATCRSPFRPDKSPSFSIYKGGRLWKDFSTRQGGDVIDFIALARQISRGKALRVFLDMLGIPLEVPTKPRPRPQQTHSTSSRQGTPNARPTAQSCPPGVAADSSTAGAVKMPEKLRAEQQAAAPEESRSIPLHNGTEADRQLVADTRHITPEAVSLALALRTLTFAIVQGFRCWLLTDAEGRIAEARRLDGKAFPAAGPLGRRKAHTLRGSRKSWPLGAAVLRRVPDFKTLLLVEGGPDYLAALHFAHELQRWDVLPVAMLGRGTGTRMDAAALQLMRGRRVRIYPHADADGGGLQSARMWAVQLHTAGCAVDTFDFSELRRTDGKPVKDLNDCTTGLDEKSATIVRESLFPNPDLEVDPPF
ncbi:CHC2 zinc finger domain-containing protein [Prosthecobacter sp.]|uniref:CHC2 zinc finger domain-containing protein n=1 Tax=Prosthecobacter sp. TaxID=1965333 RepID=UPI003783E021